MLLSLPAAAFTPRVALRTTAGDIVLKLRPDAAPKQAARFLNLCRAGVYDRVPVIKVDAVRLIHFGGVARRLRPLSAAQRAILGGGTGETGGLRHRPRVVSLARELADPGDPGTAFVVLLAEIPPMNGRFTAFAEVEAGWETVAAIARAPAGLGLRPLAGIEILEAVPLETPAALAAFSPRPAQEAALGTRARRLQRERLALAGAILLAAGLLGVWRVRRARGRAAALLAALAGFFLLFAGTAQVARQAPALGLLLFFGAAGVFRLMGLFERS